MGAVPVFLSLSQAGQVNISPPTSTTAELTVFALSGTPQVAVVGRDSGPGIDYLAMAFSAYGYKDVARLASGLVLGFYLNHDTSSDGRPMEVYFFPDVDDLDAVTDAYNELSPGSGLLVAEFASAITGNIFVPLTVSGHVQAGDLAALQAKLEASRNDPTKRVVLLVKDADDTNPDAEGLMMVCEVKEDSSALDSPWLQADGGQPQGQRWIDGDAQFLGRNGKKQGATLTADLWEAEGQPPVITGVDPTSALSSRAFMSFDMTPDSLELPETKVISAARIKMNTSVLNAPGNVQLFLMNGISSEETDADVPTNSLWSYAGVQALSDSIALVSEGFLEIPFNAIGLSLINSIWKGETPGQYLNLCLRSPSYDSSSWSGTYDIANDIRLELEFGDPEDPGGGEEVAGHSHASAAQTVMMVPSFFSLNPLDEEEAES